MAYAFVQQQQGSSSDTATVNISANAALSATAGNLIVIEVSYFSGAQKTFNFPATWGTVVQPASGVMYNATDGAGVIIGYVENCSASSGTGSGTFSASVDFPSMTITEYSGIATSSALIDSIVFNRQVSPGTGANAVTASVNATAQPALIRACTFALTAQNFDTAVSGTGRTRVWDYTNGGGGTTFSAKPQDKRVTATGSTSLTLTTNAGTDTYHTWIMAFAETGAGGGGAVKRNNLALMGAGR